jgi:hypothetical protein
MDDDVDLRDWYLQQWRVHGGNDHGRELHAGW